MNDNRTAQQNVSPTRDAFEQSLRAVRKAIDTYRASSPAEQERLRRDLTELQEMEEKLTHGRLEIVLFGEISTGKSALINALAGKTIAEVDVQGGWTKQAHRIAWSETEYVVPGLEQSELVLIDTPGINEVGDSDHQAIARRAAVRGDLILFVADSDINEIEFSAIMALAAVQKPILFVLNKADLYTPQERDALVRLLRDERLAGIIPPENFVITSADPRPVEHVMESANGSVRSQWRKPAPDVETLKERIVEVLERDGLALIALNAAMYAADKSDRIAKLRLELRGRSANQAIWSFAVTKSVAVALNPIAVADVLGGTAVDAAMIVSLAHLYGLELSWAHAHKLVRAILTAAGWMTVTELAFHFAAGIFKSVTLGAGGVLSALPQGAVAGYGSYIVGNAAKYYFEHGASWGSEGPKAVVRRILQQTDRASVLEHLKKEIRKKIATNVHGEP